MWGMQIINSIQVRQKKCYFYFAIGEKFLLF